MKLQSISYSVYFEDKNFSYLKRFLQEKSFSNIFILCDENTQKHCLPMLLKKITSLKNAKIVSISAGEKHKNIQTAISIWNFLLQQNADKNSLLINLGGGVVCDIGGFSATTFKRGIHFINIPTTLLAMADASVGGKNGIDFGGYKNLIGTITQPQGVFIYDDFLKTLSERELKNGFAEVVKSALIADNKLWKKIAVQKKINYTDFIFDAVSIKNKIVSKDPQEKNIRKILNFGHTIGHAIEAYFVNKKNNFLHGEAIAIGMYVELCLGKIVELTSPKAAMEAILWLKKNYTLRFFSEKEIENFITLMKHDKKNKNNKIHFSLIEDIAKPLINITASVDEVKQAFSLYNNLVRE